MQPRLLFLAGCLCLMAQYLDDSTIAAPPDDLLKDVEPRGQSPAEALRSIRVAPGFTVEQVATEPLVKDPIAFDWGADGKLWVVEMGDYPLGIDGKGKPGGVVRFLEDIDGDGKYDNATTFLEGLGFPNGVMPWRRGILVSCAPDIFYAEDRDGDGKAEHREVLFTGFVKGNQQHRLNGFELGLDGWVYGANGDSGGQVKSLKTGKLTSISGRDFRFKPDTGEFETESGQTQYGRHRDDWGHWFGNNNPNWGWHYVLSEQDLRRNPYYAAPDPKQTLEYDTNLHPISRTLARFNDPGAANHTTSANSPTPYRDELLGPGFASSLFVSEPVHNIVHRMVLEPKGVTFRGSRGPNESNREFLASTDNWFRPTMLKTGPDGALWIADMYRQVIEHPEWIPDEWEKKLDLRAGSEEGRIYRVYPVDRKPRPITRLDRLDTKGLVAALDSPSGWQRDTAQRLLLHRGGTEAFAPLRALVLNAKQPKTRVQAIWTLADLGGLDEPTVQAALTDRDARVKESVIAAVSPLLRSSPKVAQTVVSLADDRSIRVRFQVSLIMGNWDDHRGGEVLARIGRRDGNDEWMQAAILTSSLPHVATLLSTLLGTDEEGIAPPPHMVEPLLEMAGAIPGVGLNAAVARTIGKPAGPGGHYAPWQFAALAGLLAARDRSKATPHPRPGQALRRAMGGRAASSRTTRPPRPTGSRPCRSCATPRCGIPPIRSCSSRCSGLKSQSGSSKPRCRHSADRPSQESPTDCSGTGRTTRLRSAARSSTPRSAGAPGPRRCSFRWRTAACRPPRSTRPVDNGCSAVATRRRGLGRRPYSRTRPSPVRPSSIPSAPRSA